MLSAHFKRTALFLGFLAFASASPAVNIVIDYSYDTNNFFGAGNPSGAAEGEKAKATIDAAAAYFTEILTDDLVSIQEPEDYISTANGGSPVSYSWNMQAQFSDPETGSTVQIEDPNIPADEFRIYVGSRPLLGSRIGEGGPGGYSASWGGSYYFGWQWAEITEITSDFQALIENRSQPTGDFGSWGGSLTFDPTANWHYDHSVDPEFGMNDLFSVALHEIGHVIGFGTSDEWSALASGGQFLGAESYNANGNSYPTVTGGHWTSDLRSPVYGLGGAPVETAMDPELQTGSRALWTELDAAALADIGWMLSAPDPPNGDFNNDGQIDAADYTTWRDGLGTVYTQADYQVWRNTYGTTPALAGTLQAPEPVGLALAAFACVGMAARRR